jgi:hypothetical protein
MKVKVLQSLEHQRGRIEKDSIFEVRRFPVNQLAFSAYQIMDNGKFAGVIIPRKFCKEYKDKLYTTEEWNSFRSEYEHKLQKVRQQNIQLERILNQAMEDNDTLRGKLQLQKDKQQIQIVINISAPPENSAGKYLHDLLKHQHRGMQFEK